MSSSSGIPCCCKNAKFLCCLTLDMEATCTTATVSDCSVVPGPPQTIAYTTKYKKWVNSREECNCDHLSDVGRCAGSWCDERCGQSLDCNSCACGGCPDCANGGGGFGSGQDKVVGCSATFHENITEDGESADNACSNANTNKICVNTACGPCGRYVSGCSVVGPDEDCPPGPTGCTPQECCDGGPKELCCCRTVENSCISSVACGECASMNCSGSNQHKSSVTSCGECSVEPGAPCLYITGVCCPSCDNGGCYDGSPCPCTCATKGSNGEPTCAVSKCVCPCGVDTGGLPLCGCPIESITEGCPSQLTGYGVNYANLDYGNNLNSAEGRYTSGIVVDKNGVSQLNTLFLFGYGYNNL